jgi:hypothetical protein
MIAVKAELVELVRGLDDREATVVLDLLRSRIIPSPLPSTVNASVIRQTDS